MPQWASDQITTTGPDSGTDSGIVWHGIVWYEMIVLHITGHESSPTIFISNYKYNYKYNYDYATQRNEGK